MEILNLEKTENTPAVLLDKKGGIFEISGNSIPEDPSKFYKPVIAWIRQYAQDPNPSTDFVFKLEYYNTASAKMIIDVLYAMEGITGIRIQWYFDEDDEDMEEAGQEFSELVKIPFQFKTS